MFMGDWYNPPAFGYFFIHVCDPLELSIFYRDAHDDEHGDDYDDAPFKINYSSDNLI